MSNQSPAENVGSNDDLLTEILLRLPVRSLLRFKSVSKHCYFLISTPRFKLLRNRNPDRPSGLFVPVISSNSHLECEFIPFDIENPVKPPFRIRTFNFIPNAGRIDILHSCNGLMLCGSRDIEMYCVYNPTLNQFATLPKLNIYDNLSFSGLTIAFDPSKSPYYRVVYVCGFDNNGVTSYEIVVYSSQTCAFKSSCKFLLDVYPDINIFGGVYWNNAIHWLHETGFVLYFDLNQEIVLQIKTPFALLGLDYQHYFSYIFESCDHLLVVETNFPLTSKFKIHELKKDYSGWFVKYHVDLEDVGGSFPEIVNSQSRVTSEFSILSLVLGEKEDDSFLVLQIPGKAVRFNLVSKTFHKLCDFPLSYSQSLYGVFPLWPRVFQFVESLYSIWWIYL